MGPREDYISGANKHWEPLFYNSFASKVKNWFPASKQKRTTEFDQNLAELHYRQFLAKIWCERYLRSHIGSHDLKNVKVATFVFCLKTLGV